MSLLICPYIATLLPIDLLIDHSNKRSTVFINQLLSGGTMGTSQGGHLYKRVVLIRQGITEMLSMRVLFINMNRL